MAKVAYFDCFSGCSGDMVLGALIDAGLSLTALQKALSTVNVHGYKLSTDKVKRCTVMATKFNVAMSEEESQPSRSLEDIAMLIKAAGFRRR